MYTDPIADFLTRIRNANMAHQTEVTVPYSKKKEAIANVMEANNFVVKVAVTGDKVSEKELVITLNPEIDSLTLKRVSKPGQRIYRGSQEMQEIKNGLGIQIVSTSKGMMTSREAKDQNIGGEVICDIY